MGKLRETLKNLKPFMPLIIQGCVYVILMVFGIWMTYIIAESGLPMWLKFLILK